MFNELRANSKQQQSPLKNCVCAPYAVVIRLCKINAYLTSQACAVHIVPWCKWKHNRFWFCHSWFEPMRDNKVTYEALEFNYVSL